MRPLIVLLIALSTALLPAAAVAQDGGDDNVDDFTLRIDRDITVPANETLGTLVVISANVRVEGRVDDSLVVIDGDAVITGSVGEDVTVIDGNLTLAGSSNVKDVNLISSDLTREPGAQVTGDVSEREDFFSTGAALLFGIFLWVGFTVALLVGGLLFAAIGRRQLMGAAALMTDRPGATVLTAIVTVIVLPIIAVIALITIIGIPAGIFLLLFLIPALAFLGYIVAGAMIGRLVLGGFGDRGRAVNAFAAVVLGIVILQIALLIPVVGVASVLIGMWGVGGLVFYAIRAARGGPREERPLVAPPTSPPPPEPAG
ncbi:MAG TPA: hypothetical protein VFY90_04830 [Tepidiformaceae bacterium]|nr:hypothetical protein [Tepidiformaceae bacterium]